MLGRYYDLAEIGGGAMGTVYRAIDPDMGHRTVAIKAPKSANGQLQQRFEREIVASARLQHPNIVRALARGEVDGLPYLVMEFVDGQALSEVVRSEHPLAAARVARIVRDVAAGLTHAARPGAVHRDIKPENILVDEQGAAKILDYGLALLRDLGDASDQVTRPGVLLGTTGYMAPEQAADSHGVTILADVYALGCTAYFALTRQLPFKGADSIATLHMHATEPRPSVRALRPDAPEALDRLIRQMMAVDPAQRPQPREIVQTLEQLLPTLSEAPPVPARTVSGEVEATCPDCGKSHLLHSDAAGRLVFCENQRCGAMFRVESPGIPPTSETTLVGVANTADFPSFARDVLDQEEGVVVGEAVDEPFLGQVQSEDATEEVLGEVVGEMLDVPQVADSPLADALPAADGFPPGEVVSFARALPVTDESEPPSRTTADPLRPTEGFGDTMGFADGQPSAGVPTFPDTAIVAEPTSEAVPVEEAVVGEPIVGKPFFGSTAPGEPTDVIAEALPWRPEMVESVAAEPAAPSPFEQEVLAAPAAETDPKIAAQFPFEAIAAERDEPSLDVFPEASVVAEPALAPLPTRRRSRYVTPLLVTLGGLLVMGGVTLAWLWFKPQPPGPDDHWAEIQENYQLQKWTAAEKGLEKFPKQFPDSPHVAEVPFFLAMCQAGRDVFSQTGDATAGLAQIQTIFLDYRDKPEYNLYCADLYMALVRLIERLTEQAQRGTDPQKLASAREAHELLTTVAQAMQDEWVPERTAKLTAAIYQAEKELAVDLAKEQLTAVLEQCQSPDVAGEKLDEQLIRSQEILAQHPKLAEDKTIAVLIDSAYQSEAGRVRYERETNDDAPAPSTRPTLLDRNTTYVVWDDTVGAPTVSARSSKMVFALARGVLYAFDARGNYRWSRRLGFDAHRLPILIEPSATLPAMAIAVSTLDNSLVALDPATGNLLWRYQAGEGHYLSAPPTLVEVSLNPNAPPIVRGLLPTADGEVHVLELVLGKRIGRFRTGFPMTVEGAYDPATGLAFFPADSRRVFALNPAAIESTAPDAPAAHSVLYTNHASGALRSRPVVVGQYLLLIESSELQHTRVQAFQIRPPLGFPDPQAEAVKSVQLRGWSWFTPPTTPDRITVVTDEGDLGVFGLNLDNPDEALYLMIHDAKGACPRLPVRDAYRTLAIHSDEHLLWLMAGGSLRHMALDLLHQKARTLWPADDQPAEVTGLPVHEAVMDDALERIYIATQAPRGAKIEFASVNAETGAPLWRRQLGVSPVGDPLVLDDGVLLVDRTGRSVRFALSAAEEPAGAASVPQGSTNQTSTGAASAGPPRREITPPLRVALDDALPAGATAGDLMRLADETGRLYLAVTVERGKAVAVRSLARGAESAWRRLPLLAVRLQGRPAIVQGHLIAPCSDGRLYRIPLAPGRPTEVNEQPFTWAAESSLSPQDQAEVYPLAADRVLLTHGRRALWLQFKTDEPVQRWVPVGRPYVTSADVLGAVPLVGDGLILATRQNQLLRITGPERHAHEWSLPGRITAPPVPRGDRLVTILDDRRVVSIALDAPPGDDLPGWISDPFRGRVCGHPVLAGNELLVTDESGRVTGLDAQTGELLWRIELGRGALPAAAAVPLGQGRLFAPLRDGSVVQWTLPQNVAAKYAGVQQP